MSEDTRSTVIFVFGSNLAGRHGRGAALSAVRLHGAKYGQGEGMQGNSYAIPTKDERLRTLPLQAIQAHVNKFIVTAYLRPGLSFYVTPIGTGLAGYRHEDIAPMFAWATPNCHLPPEWRPIIEAVRAKAGMCV